MAELLDGSRNDQTVVDALGPRSFASSIGGVNEVNGLPRTAVVRISTGQTTTIGALLDFNDRLSGNPLNGISEELGYLAEIVVGGFGELNEYELRLTRDLGESRAIFVLLKVFDHAVNAVSTIDSSAELQELLSAEDWPSIEILVEAQVLAQRRLLGRLNVVASAHRDAMQNAVDTVQTKRLDFVEGPEEATIGGALAALVVEVCLSVIPGAIAGPVVLQLADGLFRLTRRSRIRQAEFASRLAEDVLSRHSSELNELMASLAKARQDLRIAGVPVRRARRLNRRSVQRAQAAVDSARAEAARADDVLNEIALESASQAHAISKALTFPTVTSTIDTVVGRVSEDVAQNVKDGPVKADPRVGLSTSSQLPVDVAMKMQVQGFFDRVLGGAELSIQVLEEFKFLVKHYRSSPGDDILELVSQLVIPDEEIERLIRGWDRNLDQIGTLRAQLERDYELTVWALMYFDMFRSGLTPERSTSAGGSWTGGPVPNLTGGDIPAGTNKRVLAYIRLRFFPPQAISPPPPPTDGDLKVVLIKMQQVVGGIDALINSTTSERFGADSMPSDVAAILKTIQIGSQSTLVPDAGG